MTSLEAAQAAGNALVEEPVKHVNNLVPLLKILEPEFPEEVVVDVMQTLRIFFVEALHSNAAHAGKSTPDAESQYLSFVRKKYISYQSKLHSLLQAPTGVRVQLGATVAILEAVRAESASAFANTTFTPLVASILTSRHVHADVLSTFISKCSSFADMRYYALKHVRLLSDRLSAAEENSTRQEWQASQEDVVASMFDMLSQLTDAPTLEGGVIASWCGGAEAGVARAAVDSKEGTRARRKRKRLESGDAAAPAQGYSAQWASLTLQKQAYSEAWLAFLRVPLQTAIFKRVLALLPTTVMPRLTNPLLLSDFLTHSLDSGGLVGILALNGLFTLVTQYGLEYPEFYARVYTLLQAHVLTARFRLRFLQLVDIFLASPLVPAYTAAAFAKRFARMALTAPPPGAIVCIAFVHNLLRRHPSCICLLHRPVSQEGADVYDDAQTDPAKSRAVESSLWELEALRRHQNAAVSSFALHLDKDLTDRRKTSELDMQGLLLETYASMVQADLKKRLKAAPAVAHYASDERPTALFQNALPGWRLTA